ncbi:MAG: Ig-like domain-containing protein [Chloroflexi bacterium]|nr:Ig-like domain-containing protein [Chloroflexota bacterium]
MKSFRSYLTRRTIVIALVAIVIVVLGATLGPLALTGPRIVRVTPSDGATDISPQSAFRVEFDQWVLPASIEAAIEPPVPLTIEWQRSAVVIRPQSGLSYNTRYRLTVKSARNILGRASSSATPIAFATLPYATVARFGPEQGTADVAQRAPITVEFSAPVVAAEKITAAAQDPKLADSLPQPLALSPQQAGVGRWLSPTLYGFYPENGLHAATTYTATVRADVTADGRTRLEKPVSWQFTTEAPLLAGTRPFDGATDVPTTSEIEARLAPDVDSGSAKDHFALYHVASGAQVQGTVETNAGSLRFKPASPLDRSARYEARLAPGIRTTTGAVLNNDQLSWNFTVMGDLEVAQVEPPVDTAEVLTTTRRISVRFNHPVVAVTALDAQANQPQPLQISPAIPGEGRWLDTSTYVFSPTTTLPPATRFEARVSAGLQDQTGGTLANEYTWSFSTIQPIVVRTSPMPDDRFASPRDALRIEFNQSMSLDSLRGAIQLQHADSGANVAGTVAMKDSIATFMPAESLERGATYVLSIARSARSADGAGALKNDHAARFRVAPLPRLEDTLPKNGQTNVEVGMGVTVNFSTPMDWASVEKNLTIDPKPTQIYTGTYESQLTLGFRMQPETDYRVTIGGASSDRDGVALGDDTSLTFRTGSLPPALSIIGQDQIGTYNAHVPARVPLRHVGTPTVSYRLARVDVAQIPELLSSYDAWQNFQPPQPTVIKEGQQQMPGDRNEQRIDLLDLGKLDPGAYYVDVRGPGSAADRRLMIVSPYALTLKRSADKVFVWAVDLATGLPVGELPLLGKVVTYDTASYSGTAQLELRELGSTDDEGILHTNFASSNAYDPLYVWSPVGKDFAFTTTNWSTGIGAWDFGLPADYGRGPIAGSISTDRPLYQPEHTVYIRGALRTDHDGRYALPDAGQKAHLLINDPQGTAVMSSTLSLSEFGTFNSELTLARSAKLGGYTMLVRLAQDLNKPNQPPAAQGVFTVSEYRRPAFEVTVKPAKPDLIQGETMEVEVAARYFSSGPVANAPVRWRLRGYPSFFRSETNPNFSFEDFDDAYEAYHWFESGSGPQGSELVSEGTAKTDAQGRLMLRLPAELGKTNHSRTLTLDVEITDVDGQVIAGQGSADVHAGSYYIGLRPEGYVAEVGQAQTVSLITVDPQDKIVPQQALEIGIYQREWYSAREQGSDGRLYWTSKFTDTLVETQKATTDGQGRGSIRFTPTQGGNYRIAATGRDAAGHTIKSSVFSWVSGGETFWGVNDTNRIDLIADKASYKPGETAKILVPAPYKGMTALMTIERGEVIQHRLLTIGGTTELLEVPITADHAPNIYVSLVLVKAADQEVPVPDLRVGLINLPVSTEQQELTIAVTPDKTSAGPRDEVTYTIKATDHTGKGVKAEVGVALVDKSVLSLADDPNPTLRQAFYEKRPLGVFTAHSLTTLMDRVTLRIQASAKGGGGGAASDPLVRREFPDTAYWNPSVVTSDDGTAKVSLRLPDTLTTWTMTTRGLTTDTRVGQATTDLIATRPLLIRPSLPRFLTVGDQPTLQAVIHNTSSSAIEATVMLDPGEIVLTAPKQQTVNVPAGGQSVVRWTAEVPKAGETTLRFTVQGGGLEDVIEQKLTIQRFVTPEVVASAGQVQGTIVETLQTPDDNQQGEVRLEMVPTLAAGIESGLEYLEQYPYGCTEQTVSRFLPNAVTYRLYKQMGIENQALKTSLEQNLTVGMQRLASLQQLDGGWSWWNDGDTDPYLSAYVVQGLLEARKAGYGVDQQMLDRGLAFLQNVLDSGMLNDRAKPWLKEARPYVLYVLAEAGKADRGRTIALFDERHTLAIYGRSYLLMTLHTLGNEDERIRTLVGELMSSAVLGPTHGHWEEREAHYWSMNTDTRTTALALQALVRSDPDNFLVPNAVRYLMSVREDGHWRSTQETASALMALIEYTAQTGELEANYSYSAALDGKVLSNGKIDGSNLTDPINVVIALADLKAGGASQLTLDRQGDKGRLYYTLRMRYYQDAADVQPLDQGLAVQREYSAVDSTTLTATGELIKQAKLGDVVQVRLTLTVPENVRYLAVEDMLPAGLEALDTSLKTVSDFAQGPEFDNAATEYPDWWYFNQTEIRHDRVALFATDLPKGTYHYTYLARATTPGSFQTLPATAYQMYAPEVFGRSAGAEFVVTAP